MLAAPVWAQMINAPGLYGQAACDGGNTHIGSPPHIGITSVVNSAGTQQLYPNNFSQITYSFLRGRIGDGGTASSFPVNPRVVNARTGATVTELVVGTFNSTDTSLPNAAVGFSAAAKTPYFAILYANVPGLGVANPLDA
ncbi:MAG: hypothetical protein OXE85_13515 [Roseovarius sp.]|nr:hypothetical protein [Roseovarius sp.]